MCLSCNTDANTWFGRRFIGRRGLFACSAAAGALYAVARRASAQPVPGPFADTLIENARIVTLDPGSPTADAIAVAGDRILRVGAGRDMRDAVGPATRVIDAGGRTVWD